MVGTLSTGEEGPHRDARMNSTNMEMKMKAKTIGPEPQIGK